MVTCSKGAPEGLNAVATISHVTLGTKDVRLTMKHAKYASFGFIDPTADPVYVVVSVDELVPITARDPRV